MCISHLHHFPVCAHKDFYFQALCSDSENSHLCTCHHPQMYRSVRRALWHVACHNDGQINENCKREARCCVDCSHVEDPTSYASGKAGINCKTVKMICRCITFLKANYNSVFTTNFSLPLASTWANILYNPWSNKLDLQLQYVCYTLNLWWAHLWKWSDTAWNSSLSISYH